MDGGTGAGPLTAGCVSGSVSYVTPPPPHISHSPRGFLGSHMGPCVQQPLLQGAQGQQRKLGPEGRAAGMSATGSWVSRIKRRP